MEKHDLNYFINQYLELIKVEKSKRTYAIYKLALSRLAEFFGTFSPEAITSENINFDFVNSLKKDYQLTELSIYDHLRNVRYFFVFLDNQKIKSLNPNLINDKKMYEQLKKHISSYQGDILSSIEKSLIQEYWRGSADRSNPRGIRNQIIIKLLSSFGLTVSELTFLKISDINLNKHELIVDYGNKDGFYRNRTIKYDSETSVLFNKYFDIRNDKCDALIVAYKAQDPFIVDAWPLTPRQIQRIIHNTCYDLKIGKKISPQTFRNTLIKELDARGARRTTINNLLGLSETSMRYVLFRDESGRAKDHITSHKLSEEDVRTIRKLHSEGVGVEDLKDRFNIHKSTVYDIVSKKTWSNVKS